MTRLSQSISRARKSRSKPSVMTIAASMPIRQAMDEVVLVLPVPPSKNRLHMPNGRGGICRTPEYRAWLDAAGWRLLAQKPGRIDGKYALLIEIPEGMRGDVANREVALSDFLQMHGIVSNDRLAEDVRSVRGDGPEFRVTVTFRSTPCGDQTRITDDSTARQTVPLHRTRDRDSGALGNGHKKNHPLPDPRWKA